MAGNLTYEYGFQVSLQFTSANVAENTTTDLTLAGGNAGVTVPTGYVFHPLYLLGASNAALNTGNATLYVTSNTTALTNGPTAALNANTQSAFTTQRPGVEGITAGKKIGVNIVADANFAPNTLDVDAVLLGVLLPA